MKKILFIFLLFGSLVYGQCPNNNTFFTDLTPTGVGNTNSVLCIFTGEYGTVTVCNGAQYTFTTCGNTGNNTALTLYTNAGVFLAFSSANTCGQQETIIWTSTFNGVVRILVDGGNGVTCNSGGGTCNMLSVTQNTLGTCPPPPPPSTNQDCSIAVQVCNDISFTGNSNGFGTQELNAGNSGCLLGNEHQSAWYVFQAATSGTVSLNITTAVDYDFAIWGPNLTCGTLGLPIRCSFSGLYGNTGLGSGATDFTDGDGNGANGFLDAWVAPLTVVAGQTYIMLIDNYTSNTTPFTLDWTMGGGATLNCTPILPIELLYFKVEKKSCNQNLISWSTASEVNNDHFEVESSSDGISFNRITIIKGSDNSTHELTYSYIDYNPIVGDNFYKLKQVDKDNHEIYFNIIHVDNSCASKLKQIKITNILGQDVYEDYRGPIFIYYNDGSVIKKYNF